MKFYARIRITQSGEHGQIGAELRPTLKSYPIVESLDLQIKINFIPGTIYFLGQWVIFLFLAFLCFLLSWSHVSTVNLLLASLNFYYQNVYKLLFFANGQSIKMSPRFSCIRSKVCSWNRAKAWSCSPSNDPYAHCSPTCRRLDQ